MPLRYPGFTDDYLEIVFKYDTHELCIAPQQTACQRAGCGARIDDGDDIVVVSDDLMLCLGCAAIFIA